MSYLEQYMRKYATHKPPFHWFGHYQAADDVGENGHYLNGNVRIPISNEPGGLVQSDMSSVYAFVRNKAPEYRSGKHTLGYYGPHHFSVQALGERVDERGRLAPYVFTGNYDQPVEEWVKRYKEFAAADHPLSPGALRSSEEVEEVLRKIYRRRRIGQVGKGLAGLGVGGLAAQGLYSLLRPNTTTEA